MRVTVSAVGRGSPRRRRREFRRCRGFFDDVGRASPALPGFADVMDCRAGLAPPTTLRIPQTPRHGCRL